LKHKIYETITSGWWDSFNWTRGLEFIDKNKSSSFLNKTVLEIGGKNADMSVWAAKSGGNVICSDIIKEHDLRLKEKDLMKKYFIVYENINALNIPYKNKFDFVLFKSVLGGIGRKGHHEKHYRVINEIYKSLKKGGELLFIENMQGSFIHEIIRNKYGAGRNDWLYPSYENFISYSKRFHKIKYKTFGIISVNGTNNKQQLYRLFINANLEKILSKKSRYIFAGVFKK
tara:strand:+ start:3900 stop:4586 length:687 start_codon:yes stop_codon:yes gene_type:complete